MPAAGSRRSVCIHTPARKSSKRRLALALVVRRSSAWPRSQLRHPVRGQLAGDDGGDGHGHVEQHLHGPGNVAEHLPRLIGDSSCQPTMAGAMPDPAKTAPATTPVARTS